MTPRIELAGPARILIFVEDWSPRERLTRRRLALAFAVRPDQHPDGGASPGVVLVLTHPPPGVHGGGHYPSLDAAVESARRMAAMLNRDYELFIEPDELCKIVDGAIARCDDEGLRDAARYFFVSQLPRQGARDISGTAEVTGYRCNLCRTGWRALQVKVSFTGIWQASPASPALPHKLEADATLAQPCAVCRKSAEVN